MCNDGNGPHYFLRTGCTTTTSQRNAICGSTVGGYDTGNCQGPVTYYSCTSTYVTVSTTNYNSNFRLVNNTGVLVNTQYNTNSSSYSSAGSLAVSTAGDVITYSVYSGANKSGLLHSGTYTATGATKGRGVGVYKGDGGSNQGSSVDNFSVTVI